MLKHVEIVNKDGRIIRGYHHIPENFNGDMVVFFHGFTGNKTEHDGHFRNLARLLEKEGIASLRMDFSGNGESDGEFYDFTYDTMLPEALQMVDYAKNVEGFKRLIILGFSMGGAVASTVSSLIPNDIYKIILWSPAGDMGERIVKRYETLEKNERENVMLGVFEMSKAMYESAKKWDPMKGIDKFLGDVLIVHGRLDKSVDPLIGAKYAVSYKNSHLCYIDGAGHGYDGQDQYEKLYKLSIDFLK